MENQELINQILEMEEQFNNNSLYLKYEKIYKNNETKKIFKNTISADIPDEMISIFLEGLDNVIEKPKLTPELIMKHKDGTIKITQDLIELTITHEEHKLTDKLEKFIKLLKQL
jgi:hypothetical protein